jgi:2-C-methyl-D-erythritol 4-phosphate cytidylyltransferase
MNTAIIVAAGESNRFGGDIPKQFVEIDGRPLISYTLSAFESARSIDHVVLVVAPDFLERSHHIAANVSKVRKIVRGGDTRVRSVINGFSAVDRSTEVVAVHDGARPLVTAIDIDSVIETAAKCGAACLTAPVSDTIKRIDGQRIVETIDRDQLRRALTPQAFHYSVLSEAVLSNEPGADVTDECILVERLGRTVVYVDGSPHNIKITYPEDLVFARAVLSSRN